MYVLHVNEVHEMWQDAAKGNLTLLFISSWKRSPKFDLNMVATMSNFWASFPMYFIGKSFTLEAEK